MHDSNAKIRIPDNSTTYRPVNELHIAFQQRNTQYSWFTFWCNRKFVGMHLGHSLGLVLRCGAFRNECSPLHGSSCLRPQSTERYTRRISVWAMNTVNIET